MMNGKKNVPYMYQKIFTALSRETNYKDKSVTNVRAREAIRNTRISNEETEKIINELKEMGIINNYNRKGIRLI